MSPTPQDASKVAAAKMVSQLNGDSIVISGMSGAFPQANNVQEFSDILYNKVNPVSSEGSRWNKWEHPEAPKFSGKVPNIDRFDSQFFMVHHRLASWSDPMAKKVLEHSYQAIYDAGLNPKHLNGKKVGVYIAFASSDAENRLYQDNKKSFGLLGCSKAMYANRVSYWLNTKGPSLTICEACCGFNQALEEAYKGIRSGSCEAAIVGGTHLCLYPHSQVHYSRCMKMSPDNKTKCFDANADGFTKSDAVSIMFIQKARNALRVYAEIINIKNEFISKLSDENGPVYGFVRNPDDTAAFLKRFYSDTDISPETVEYVEGFGTAQPESDKAELQAIENVFCANRTDPLLVGSVISNVGYTESVSGGVALTKVLLGYHKSLLASNLNCDTPRQDVAAIRDGRMCIVREHLPFRGSLAAVNCLSLTGVNSHVLLRGLNKTKDSTRYRTSIPRLVVLSARQEDLLGVIFEDLKSRPIDPEELALLHNIHSRNISGHLGRGYIILDTNQEQKTISLSEKAEYYDDAQRPLWFVYSGMGSQWPGMGTQFMRIPIFAAVIERCHRVMEPKGIDLVHIITSPDKSLFDNILNSFIGIAAIQIALTEVLTALGIKPDKIIGHSVGELGCAFADGCLTAEEVILSAWSRGMASLNTPLIKGAMAAIGLGYNQLKDRCPSEIDIACHNGPDSSTISGPADIVHTFVDSLTAQGIFAKEVATANIAYHSRYIADAGPYLKSQMSAIISKPRARSDRWISTSVPQERWNEPFAQYCSEEYITNNLLSPVYFEEASRLIPDNAVLIEIAPHGLLQAILRRSLPQSCTNIPLAQRAHNDNVHALLDAIGKLYIKGYNPIVQTLYPRVEFPVSTGTPHLSHLVRWYHAESWPVLSQDDENTNNGISNTIVTITIHDDKNCYLNGNVIQGRVLYPFAATLVTIWDTLAMTHGLTEKEFSVQFDDLHFYAQPILHNQKSLKLTNLLNKGNGYFEVLDGDSKVASGYVKRISHCKHNSRGAKDMPNDEVVFDSKEIYEYLYSRGYSYWGEFQSIHSVDESLSVAQLQWNSNWVTMIDGLLQLNTLRHTDDGVIQPTYIRSFTIDMKKHTQELLNGGSLMNAEVDDSLDCTKCGGIEIINMKFRKVTNFTEKEFKLIPMLSPNTNRIQENCVPDQHSALQIKVMSDFSTLHWVKASHGMGSDIKVNVEYTGLNMADINRATSMANDNNENYFGMDFSGLTDFGSRVMGIAVDGSARSIVRARSELLWPVPTHWSLEDAATVPLAYLQAYYCLFIKSQLKHDSRVLIHGGTGALGQAAISIALSYDCQVFTSVSDNTKKRDLIKLFPKLNENWIGYSRDDSIGDLVSKYTNGQGCDIIISCIRGDLKNVSLKCASFNGVTIDTVQIPNRENYEYGMFHMTKSRSYIVVNFNSLFENTEIIKRLHSLLSDGIASGEVRPLSRVSYSAREVTRAFRLLAASRHRGRVLLRLNHTHATSQHSFIISPESSHLIIWDGSSLGLQFANRLISRGVKKLRMQCLKSLTHHRIRKMLWQKLGVNVEIQKGNLNNTEAVLSILNDIKQQGPVEGIYVFASAHEDENNTNKVIELLDATSRKTCSNLKYFGVFSVGCNLGHDTCMSRSSNGYPVTALSIPSFICDPNDLLNNSSSWMCGAVNAVEQALANAVPVQIARLKTMQKPSLLKLVTAISGDVNEDCLLRDMGIEESLPRIKSFINDYYQVFLRDEDIMKLTKKRILEIEGSCEEFKPENIKKGLETFFSQVMPDEMYADADYIPLNTIVHKVKSMDEEIDVTKSHLFIIPGLEGHYGRFRTLCEHLKLPAFVLQPRLNRPDETPSQLALRYSKILLDKFQLKNNFYILAYECGIFAALELTGILEDYGLIGTLYCIGDGPEEMKIMLEEQLSEFKNEEMLQKAIVKHMFSVISGGGPAPAAVDQCLSRGEQVNVCVRALLGRVSHTAQYTRAVVAAACARLAAARRCSTTPRTLRSRLVLLRASTTTTSLHNSLQNYSQQPIHVRDLATPLVYSATDLRAPAFINSYLDNDVLEVYKNTNLCSSYNVL